MKMQILKAVVLACAAALPVWADGLTRSGVFDRQLHSHESSHVLPAADSCLSVWYHENNNREERMAEAIRTLREAVLQYPEEVNDCEIHHGASLTALEAAVEMNDVELVRFLLEHGALPFFGLAGEMESMFDPARKRAPEILNMMREALRKYSPLEAAIALKYLPQRDMWSCDRLHYYEREDMPNSTGPHAAFDRLPKAAVWGLPHPFYKTMSRALVVEGLVAGEDGVAFVAAGLGISEDGRMLSIERCILREGEENPTKSLSNYIITNTPYVFTKALADGSVSVLVFQMSEDKQTLQKLTRLILNMQGETLRTEQLYPHSHSATEYKQVDGRTSTEGLELPAADLLLAD